MSRIGNAPLALPEGVQAEINGQHVKVNGKLGTLEMNLHDDVSVEMVDNDEGVKEMRFQPKTQSRLAKCVWPTMRSCVRNMVEGVSEGYTKRLELVGVGYRAQLQGKTIVLSLGYSHEIRFDIPEGLDVKIEKPTSIEIKGIDKQKVGQAAAEIIKFRPPEPYKGKGVRHEGQQILRKEGKKK